MAPVVALDTRRKRPSARPESSARPLAEEPALGPRHGVEVIVYGSPLCPFTRVALDSLSAAAEQVPTRIVFRHLALGEDAPLGELAADFCAAAGEQGATWEAIRWLLRRGVAGLAEPGAFARSAGLDAGRLRADLQRGLGAARHREDARASEVAQTPAVFVAGAELLELAHERLVDRLTEAWLEVDAGADEAALPSSPRPVALRLVSGR